MDLTLRSSGRNCKPGLICGEMPFVNFIEQRKSERFHGELAVELKQGHGLTRDYSADGIYFVTDLRMAVGEQVELVLKLDHQNQGRAVRLRCLADVVRVVPEAEKQGVAVAITKHLFELAPEMAEAYVENVMGNGKLGILSRSRTSGGGL